jgi:hypothetical protein
MSRLSSLPADLSDLEFRTVRGIVERDNICGVVVRSTGSVNTRELWVRVLGGGEWRLIANVNIAAARRGHRVEGLYVVRGHRNLVLRFRNLDTGHDYVAHTSVHDLAGRTHDDHPGALVGPAIAGFFAVIAAGEVSLGLARIGGDQVAVAAFLLMLCGLLEVASRIMRVRSRLRLRARLLLERAYAFGPQERPPREEAFA